MRKIWNFLQHILHQYFVIPLRSEIYRITSNDVWWAYRLFLDRFPENKAVIRDKKQRLANTAMLRSEFLSSDEYLANNPSSHIRTCMSGFEGPMNVQTAYTEDELQGLFIHIQKEWQQLGTSEPYWSVLTEEKYKSSHIKKTGEEFYASGKRDLERLFNTLDRNGIDRSRYKSCLDYGCGLGRIVRWMSENFDKVYGFDISRAHLAMAGKYLQECQISNVTLVHLENVKTIMNLPRVDIIHSLIVLQHNPPPIIDICIRSFIQSLNHSGVAYFQVPTYHSGYEFSIRDYDNYQKDIMEMEIHYFPQKRIFEIIETEGARVIEILEDGAIGNFPGIRSNTFLVQKN